MNGVVDHYGWWLLALVLIAAEMIAPGYFMLWVGIAAGAMGLILLAAPALPPIAQAVLFGVPALAACLA
ncbi:MAG TPA: hypothetical protein VGC30_01980, partial [Dokdonella sp.]